MKRLFSLLIPVITFSFAICSCQHMVDSKLKVSVNKVTFSKAGGDQTIYATVGRFDGGDISSAIEWCSCTILPSETAATIHCEPNDTKEDRTCTIYMWNGDAQQPVRVFQSGE